MPGWIGPWELLILLFVILLVFGPKRLPEMGRSLGKGIRELRTSLSAQDDDVEDAEFVPAPRARDHESVG